MNSNSQNDLLNVFSILKRENTAAITRQIWREYLIERVPSSGTIKWAEIGFDGKLARCGISNMLDMTVRILQNGNWDTAMAGIIDRAMNGENKPGLLELQPDFQSFYWFIPITRSIKTRLPRKRLRVLQITKAVFREVISAYNADAGLTESEKNVIFQVVAGLRAKQAAKMDGVKYDTKRVQIKTACSKLNCRGQIDVVRLVLGQLVDLIFACDTDVTNTNIVEQFAKDNFHRDTQFVVQQLQSGRQLRYFEFGPRDGLPVLMFHGMIFPPAISNSDEYLRKCKLKLVIPIRSGFLEDQPTSALLDDDSAFKLCLHDIAEFVLIHLNAPVVVLGHNIGGAVSIEFAKKYPRLVSRLLILSPSIPQIQSNQSTGFGRFVGGLKNLSNQPGMFRLIAWHFCKQMVIKNNLLSVLRRIYLGCESDLMALESLVGEDRPRQWNLANFNHSMIGVAEDYRVITGPWDNGFEEIAIPIFLLHGSESPVVEVSQIRTLKARNANVTLKILSGCGHLMLVSHTEVVLNEIADCIYGRT